LKTIYLIIGCLLWIIPLTSHSQGGSNSLRLFGITRYSGELFFTGYYRQNDQTTDHYFETTKSSLYSGGISLQASTYILHPKFCTLDLGAGYMPGASRNDYLISRDFSEAVTTKNVHFSAKFLDGKIVSAAFFGTYDETFSRRENMTNIRTINRFLSGSLSFQNKYLPVVLTFNKRKMDMLETETGRRVNMDNYQFGGTATKSFSKYDKQILTYTYRFLSNLNEFNYLTLNRSHNILFTSNVSEGMRKKFQFNTRLDKTIQSGSFPTNYFRGNEKITIRAADNLTVHADYQYFNTMRENVRLVENLVKSSVNHKLFKSLFSTVYFEFLNANQTFYKIWNLKAGFDVQYTKELPFGQLSLGYGYTRSHYNYSADTMNITVRDEEHQLTDSKIELLKLPNVVEQSVTVRDVSGTTFYHSGLDYFLVQQGDYIEIHRIPSGQIPSGGTVYVDYTVRQSSRYKYDGNYHTFNASFFVFRKRVELYYRLSMQDYTNLDQADLVILDKYKRMVTGIKAGFNSISGGFEYEDYESTVFPYRLVRLYAALQHDFKGRVLLAVNGDVQKYMIISDTATRVQQYANVTGRIECRLSKNLTANLNAEYRKQEGYNMDLDLLSGRIEFKYVFYKWELSTGVESYRRLYIGEKMELKGVFGKISRKF